jgi:hypothetical protein
VFFLNWDIKGIYFGYMIYPLYIPVKRVIQWVSDILLLGLSDNQTWLGMELSMGKSSTFFLVDVPNKACFLFLRGGYVGSFGTPSQE